MVAVITVIKLLSHLYTYIIRKICIVTSHRRNVRSRTALIRRGALTTESRRGLLKRLNSSFFLHRHPSPSPKPSRRRHHPNHRHNVLLGPASFHCYPARRMGGVHVGAASAGRRWASGRARGCRPRRARVARGNASVRCASDRVLSAPHAAVCATARPRKSPSSRR